MTQKASSSAACAVTGNDTSYLRDGPPRSDGSDAPSKLSVCRTAPPGARSSNCAVPPAEIRSATALAVWPASGCA